MLLSAGKEIYDVQLPPRNKGYPSSMLGPFIVYYVVSLCCYLVYGKYQDLTPDWEMGTNLCPFKSDLSQSIKSNLHKRIKGQDEAIGAVVSAISGWEFQRQSGDYAPLVLALTGPTGVGKSETAYIIAESALAKQTRVGKSAKYLPSGLLQLRGEDYSAGNLEEIHESIRNRLVQHLEHCEGNAVIVFDEVQKVLPGTLEVLRSALDSRGSISHTVQAPVGWSFGSLLASLINSLLQFVGSLFGGGGIPSRERTKTVTTEHSTENVIFLFTSDSGNDQMTKLLLSYGSRSAIPQNLLLNEIKNPDNIEAILHAKVRNMAADGRHSHWADLVVDNDVLAYFSGPQLVKYTVYNTKAASSGSATGSSSSSSGGGTGEMLAAAWGGGLLGSRNARGTKVFATWGARSLENTGPLQDLRSLLHHYARPWRPAQILHVGLHSESNRELRNVKWGTEEETLILTAKSPRQLYIQWCNVTDALRVCIPRTDGGSGTGSGSGSSGARNEIGESRPLQCGENDAHFTIDDEIAFSEQCETMQFGLQLTN